MAAPVGKNAKSPDKTGQRCIICYAWEIHVPGPTRHKNTKLEHESYCPDYKP